MPLSPGGGDGSTAGLLSQPGHAPPEARWGWKQYLGRMPDGSKRPARSGRRGWKHRADSRGAWTGAVDGSKEWHEVADAWFGGDGSVVSQDAAPLLRERRGWKYRADGHREPRGATSADRLVAPLSQGRRGWKHSAAQAGRAASSGAAGMEARRSLHLDHHLTGRCSHPGVPGMEALSSTLWTQRSAHEDAGMEVTR